MRSVSFILLFVLAVSVLGPGTFSFVVSCAENEDVLGALDVCHRSAPALSSGGEMPCVQSCLSVARPVFTVHTSAVIHAAILQFILASLNEQPPESLL
jgi:hypothetical protein